MRRALAILAVLILGLAAEPAAAAPCGRACLYDVLDRYLAALQAKDPSKAPFAAKVRTSENNVALKVGDGLWGTISGLGGYRLRFADPQTGGVGFYGVVQEARTASPFGLRLKVTDGRITEVETLVARPQDAGVPFVNAKEDPLPELEETLAPDQRSSRARMIALANGYFDTLQRNDGRLHTSFDDQCNRREDGFQTTNNPDAKYNKVMALGCAAQFRLGYYHFDDRLRARRFMVVDETRGLVMTAAFIDHTGRTGDYTLTDGSTESSIYRRPHSYCLLETFKIKAGKIQRVEALLISVPYRMPSPWAVGDHPDD